MRTGTCLLLVAACSALCIAGSSQRFDKPRISDISIVKSYSGREFEASDFNGTGPLTDALQRLCHRAAPAKGFPVLSPAYVWKYGRAGQIETFLVLERDWLPFIPGTTNIRLTLLREDGERLAESQFTVGWRVWMDRARLRPLTDLDFPTIEIEATSWSCEQEQQVYAFIESRFDLIRVANKDGHADRNNYTAHNWVSGPAPPEQSEEQWEADLCHGSRAEVLRALTWLGGIHESGRNAPALKAGVASAAKVRARPAVAARLHMLAKNGLQWEREMAELALNPNDGQ